MGFGCAGLATFEQNVQVALGAPMGTTTFDLNVFDGDTGKPGVGLGHWDAGSRQLIYSLYADPLRTGSTAPANLIGSWTGNDANPTSGPLWTSSAIFMPDNDWWAVTITNAPVAQAPSGNYFYNLVIGLDGACDVDEALQSNIKIAASNPMSFRTPHFGLEGALLEVFNDGPIIYPGPFPPPGGFLSAPTTYDGTFEFFFTLPGGETELRLFDGDFDFGTDPEFPEGYPSGVPLAPCADEDDPSTTADYSGFPFSTTGASPEGVQGPGIPADDNDLDAFRRGEPDDPNRIGCVRYEVHDPNDNNVYFNDNPSGSFEWEQFVIATAASPYATDADYEVGGATLPGGVWKVKIFGLDLSNLNFWFADTCATRPQRDPKPGESPDNVPRTAACPNESVYLLGDFVWADTANPGTLDPGEAGIPGVVMELVRPSDGTVIATAKTGDATSPNWPACVAQNTGTDTNGLYCFGMDGPGTYEVRVAASNFDPGQPLAGKSSTTGGQSLTRTLSNANVLTYDFGYREGVVVNNAAVGDRVWFDTDGDGFQDGAETGLNDVTVELLDGGGSVIATTTTTGDGDYFFDHLAAGTYTVRVVAASLPAGVTPTFDFDGISSAHQATFGLTSGQTLIDVDFGYTGTGSIGDRVWNDANGDGAQGSGEAGFNGVTVRLLDAEGNVIATQMTSGDGDYKFVRLPAGTYTVQVLSTTLPSGYEPTFDRDGIATPDAAVIALAAGQNVVNADFGYRSVARGSIGDRVWDDLDSDGVQDGGEPGLPGVTMELLNSSSVVIATTTTGANGFYTFGMLPPGTYTVRVVTTTLPAGFVPTFDFDGLSTPNRATATLALGQDRTDLDFGYRVPTSPGTGTIGYWKTHPEAWPVQTITLGNVTYTKAQAIALLNTPSRGDKSIDLAKQLIGAKLNVIIGNASSCISSTISAADAWLSLHPVGSNVRGDSAAWTTGGGGVLHDTLDDYNNGRLCAPHRD